MIDTLLHRSAKCYQEDNVPFQIDPLGVQAERLYHTELAVDENLFSGTNSETLLSSTEDFTGVTLAHEESALGLL